MSCKDCGHENVTGTRFCAGCGNPMSQEGLSGDDPFIGQVVGDRYRIVERIGEGGMGIVYQAEQKLGSAIRKVAVKTLHAELSQDPSITARFHREVGTVASLEHPNTVRVYDFGSTADGTLYIAMEFLDGVPLQQVIENDGPLAPTRVAHILKQVAGSLDEAHNKGIVHRDLKPENVLLIERAGEPDVVKLVDFGIAARTESSDAEKEQKLTQQGMVLGTPPYMSPEQFTGKSVDRRSDIYSLGVMTYEMLTGQLPFHAETAWQWATHHMTSAPKSFNEHPNGEALPQAAKSAVLRSLSKDPADRQPDAGAFFDDFQTGTLPPNNQPKPAAQQAADGFKATQAMEEMPMAAAVAATQAMPEMSGPVSPAPAVLSPRAKTPEKSRGLVYGIAGLGGVLLLAMGVVAMQQGADDFPAPTPLTAANSAVPKGPTLSAPETDLTAALETPPKLEPEVPPSGSTPSGRSPSGRSPSGRAKKPPKRSRSAPAAKPASKKPKAKQPAQSAPPAPRNPAPAKAPPTKTPAVKRPAPPAPKVDACRACISAVNKKDLVTAGRSYAQCTNSRQKAKCRAKATQVAPKLATQQAYNGKCPQAKAIMVAAQQMGVPASRFSKAKKECK